MDIDTSRDEREERAGKPELADGERLAITPPQGFELVEHAELETLVGITYDCLWGMRDFGRHMFITVTWKDSNKLLIKLASEKMLAKRVDETFAKRYRKGDYRCNGYFERAIAGADAQARGFRFSHRDEGIDQQGEVLVFKRGIRCYTLSYYTRSDVAAENRAVYDEIIASLQVR